MGEHVHGLHRFHFILLVQQGKIPGLRGGIAAHVDNATWLCAQDNINHVGMHACPGWIGDDYVGLSVLSHELVSKYVFHVTRVEESVLDTVDIAVYLGVLDGLGHVLDADNPLGLSSHEVSDGSRACIEVIDQLVAREGCELSRHLI